MKLHLFCIRLLALALLLMPIASLPAHQVLPGDLLSGENVNIRYTETNPPPGPVRPVAEFEPASHVLISYPLGIPVSLVAQLSNTAEVICLVSSASQQNSATSAFNNAGVNMSRVSFMVRPTDSYWTRDFGPWFIVDGNDQFAVVDFVYNRPRPSDNAIPQYFAQAYSFPYYGMNLQQTGGNYMTDGISTVAQTTLVYSENSSVGQTGVQNKMLQYMGAQTFLGIPDPNNTYIDHIDCWGKFLAPDKVLVRSVPSSHAQYNAIEQAANYFATRNCSWGYPWKVYRVYTPQNQPYSNSLILNKKVFVPTMNSTHDAAALQVYRDALPGYEVIGIPGASGAPWESTDALHCRTHELPDISMLYISHNPLWGEHEEGAQLSINAYIKAYSGEALYSDSLKVVYRVNQSLWQSELLQELGNGNFTAMLGGFAPGDTIRYFIHAADASGRSTDHPFTGAYDTHLFYIQHDTIAPSISHTPPVELITQEEPVLFTAYVEDNNEVGQVFFKYYTFSQPEISIPMDEMGEGIFAFAYYPEFGEQDEWFYYQIIASDIANPPNQAIYPGPDQWQSIPMKIVANDDPIATITMAGIKAIYPNPFRPAAGSLMVNVKTDADADLRWTIFNIRGQKMGSGIQRPDKSGDNLILWDGKSGSGAILPSGVYLFRIEQNGTVQTRKFILGN